MTTPLHQKSWAGFSHLDKHPRRRIAAGRNEKTTLFGRGFRGLSRWLSINFYAVIIGLLLAAGWRAGAQTEVGELATRQSPTNGAVNSAIESARVNLEKHLANIAAQADPLTDAVATYKAGPTPQSGLALLKSEAVAASIGARESEAISIEAANVAKCCAGLAAEGKAAAEQLQPSLEKVSAARAEHSAARDAGFAELKAAHKLLSERGVTSDETIPPAERRRIAALLRLTGSAILSERFLRMEAGSTEAVINKLKNTSEEFAERQRNFEDLAQAFQLHSASFRTVAGSVARVSQLVSLNARFDPQIEALSSLTKEMADVDNVLAKTFDNLPDDFSGSFVTAPARAASTNSSGGVWSRLQQFIGVGGQKPELAQKEGNPQ